jgi:hypothetical protein
MVGELVGAVPKSMIEAELAKYLWDQKILILKRIGIFI